MSNRIMISYRREDSAGITGRIYDRLVAAFGEENVFKDVDSIPLGANFKAYLQDVVSQCSVMLVVIGTEWLGDDSGGNRLQDAGDFVRMEVEAALQRKILIIPLLVEGGRLPTEADLPPSMTEFLLHNGTSIHDDPHFSSSVAHLIAHLKPIVDPPAPKRTRAKPAPRSQAAASGVKKPRTKRVTEKPAAPAPTIPREPAPAPAPQVASALSSSVPAPVAEKAPASEDRPSRLPKSRLGAVFFAILGGYFARMLAVFVVALFRGDTGWTWIVWPIATLFYLWVILSDQQRRRKSR